MDNNSLSLYLLLLIAAMFEATVITTALTHTVNGVYEDEALFSYSAAEISVHASLTLLGAVSEESSNL